MMEYIAVGITCLFIGGIVGVFTLSLCIAAKERDETNDSHSDGVCRGCFGAANNDCKNCTRKGDEQGEDS